MKFLGNKFFRQNPRKLSTLSALNKVQKWTSKF